MSRAFDFTVVGVIWVIAVVIHLMAIELFAPGSALHTIASDGTEAMSGAERADLWYQMLAVWVPLVSAAGITAWAFIREYRRQTITAARQVPR